MVNEEARVSAEELIRLLLQSACMGDDSQWFQVLEIAKPSKEHVEIFSQITEAVNSIFETA